MGCEQHRKYMLTIQHPAERGLGHETIRDILASLNAAYWCMADEVATTGTPHTHVFIFRKGAIRVDAIRRKFPDCHYDSYQGTCAESRAYICKEANGRGPKRPKPPFPAPLRRAAPYPPSARKAVSGMPTSSRPSRPGFPQRRSSAAPPSTYSVRRILICCVRP